MANFTDTGSSAPTLSGYKGGGTVPPSRDPYAAPPNFGPTGVQSNCRSFQASFEGKGIVVIPFSEWGNTRIINQFIPLRGRQISIQFHRFAASETAPFQEPVWVVTFKKFDEKAFARYTTTTDVGITGVMLPPSDFSSQGISMVQTYEEDFDQFYFSVDGGVGQNDGSDIMIIVSDCASSITQTQEQ